jgi:hypothetical protein
MTRPIGPTATERAGTPKRDRQRLARAELLLQLAVFADQQAKACRSERADLIPFEAWPDDDPLRVIARTYQLTGPDLAKLLDELAGQIEARAERAGYADHWDEP